MVHEGFDGNEAPLPCSLAAQTLWPGALIIPRFKRLHRLIGLVLRSGVTYMYPLGTWLADNTNHILSLVLAKLHLLTSWQSAHFRYPGHCTL